MKKDEQLGVSRRSFLKGAGLAAAAMAGTAALAGCANESAGGADTLANTGDWLPQTWDYECDVAVVGSGTVLTGAGKAAAEGNRVIIIEAAGITGGAVTGEEVNETGAAVAERFSRYLTKIVEEMDV